MIASIHRGVVNTAVDKRHIVLSLCMIVRDNERTLDACLKGIAPWVDEMVVVDTGSTDRTPEIAKKHGAKLHYFEWIDDFSAARNQSLKHASGQWIFWMDSDDTIDEHNAHKLRSLAYGDHQQTTLGYVMQVHCPGAESGGAQDATVVDHVKMFRNLPQLRFEGRIHEQVLMPIRRLGGEVRWTDIFVVHSGADTSPAGRQRKYERDLRILRWDLEDRPEHTFVLFNLGMTCADAGQHPEAVRWLQRSLKAAEPHESHVRKVYALLVSSLFQLGRFTDADEACNEGLEHYPSDAELLFRNGMIQHELGRLEQAAESYLRALHNADDRHFASVDSAIVGYKARHNLALVYLDMGRLELAEQQWSHVVREVPTFRPAQRGLAEILLRQGKAGSAEILADRMLEHPSLQHIGAIVQAQIAERAGDISAARNRLQGALVSDPDEIETQDAWCRFLFDHGPDDQARQTLQQLAENRPDDASVRHNLALLYLRCGDIKQAVDLFQQSLRLRPNSPNTKLQLQNALKELNKKDDHGDNRCHSCAK